MVPSGGVHVSQLARGCFTKVLPALQNILLKLMYCWNRTTYISYKNFKLKVCMCAQSHALGSHTNFQLEILIINVISGIVYVHDIFWRAHETLVKQSPGPQTMSDWGTSQVTRSDTTRGLCNMREKIHEKTFQFPEHWPLVWKPSQSSLSLEDHGINGIYTMFNMIATWK